MNTLRGKNCISISRDFCREDFDLIFKRTDKIKEGFESFSEALSGKVMTMLFHEPSTRTRFSFWSAMVKLGGGVISFSDPDQSSIKKGETLADTVKMAEGYSDIIVIRHPMEGSARLTADVTEVPVINAGDGANQHPTQTLLDLYTMFQRHRNLKLGVVGDLKYGRTVHSLITALALYFPERVDKVRLISPPNLKLGDSYLKRLDQNNIAYQETEEFVLKDMNVIYMTRIQEERFPDVEEYEKVKGSYILTPQKVKQGLEEGSIIMHPLPRIDEIDKRVDSLPQAHYFTQAKNGLYVRMGLLSLVLEQQEVKA